MKIIMSLVLAIAACEREHQVHVLLGPDPVTPSQGFLCKQDADPSKLLLTAPAVFDGTTARFNMVVDIISLGGRLPGCRGEELVTACKNGACKLVAEDPSARRYCVPVQLAVSLVQDRAATMAKLTEQLRARAIVSNAPNGPVLLRAVATSQPCAELETPSNGSYAALDSARAVGCAYSCPAVLDDITGPISLSLDTLTDHCEQVVRVCTGFPL